MSVWVHALAHYFVLVGASGADRVVSIPFASARHIREGFSIPENLVGLDVRSRLPSDVNSLWRKHISLRTIKEAHVGYAETRVLQLNHLKGPIL